MTQSHAPSQYSKTCPACGGIIHPSQIAIGKRPVICPYCSEPLMYDIHYSRDVCASSLLVAMFFAWHFGFRHAMFVLVTMCATVIFALFGFFLIGILIPVPFKRFEPTRQFGPMEWLHHANRYTPTIWAGSFVLGIAISFSLGYYKESLTQNGMFILVATCATWLLGFSVNNLVGTFLARSFKRGKDAGFDVEGALHLTDKSENDQKPNLKIDQ
jgi:hypothetical protein